MALAATSTRARRQQGRAKLSLKAQRLHLFTDLSLHIELMLPALCGKRLGTKHFKPAQHVAQTDTWVSLNAAQHLLSCDHLGCYSGISIPCRSEMLQPILPPQAWMDVLLAPALASPASASGPAQATSDIALTFAVK